MKKFGYSFLILFILSFSIQAQKGVRLKFNKDGEFKIVQFTDTHVDMSKNQNLDIFELLQKIIETEKPDLAILTGDVITQDDPEKAYQLFVDLFKKENLPWVVVFGNHDAEHNVSRKKLAELVESLPLCLNKKDGAIISGTNFVLPVYGKSKKPEALLYCMDSNSYSTLEPTVKGYGWFDFSQIDWYRQKSSEYTHKNGGKPLPAVAFFHIPLPEYNLAWNDSAAIRFGEKRERVSSPDINSGMFAAMLQCGDVMGTFVGHDHYNDYIIDYHNIALAYGRASKIVRQDDPVSGGRVIVLKEGKREFETWIREKGGAKLLDCTYPKSFEVKTP
ncbi:MAG: metallophosphoesterase family protein [Bacteroidota bacterium]|nr:metallophosphoesterase family protein [Bacteroidota bacterium]